MSTQPPVESNNEQPTTPTPSLLGGDDITPAPPTETPTETPTYTEPEQPVVVDEPEQWLPEAYRNDETLTRFKNFDDFAKSYKEARSYMGKLVKPIDEKSTPEEVHDFYQKIGKPAKAEEYEIDEESIPAEVPKSEELLNSFKEVAYKTNLTKEQAKELTKFHNQLQAAEYQRYYQEQEKALEQASSELKSEWGADFKDNLRTT